MDTAEAYKDVLKACLEQRMPDEVESMWNNSSMTADTLNVSGSVANPPISGQLGLATRSTGHKRTIHTVFLICPSNI